MGTNSGVNSGNAWGRCKRKAHTKRLQRDRTSSIINNDNKEWMIHTELVGGDTIVPVSHVGGDTLKVFFVTAGYKPAGTVRTLCCKPLTESEQTKSA